MQITNAWSGRFSCKCEFGSKCVRNFSCFLLSTQKNEAICTILDAITAIFSFLLFFSFFQWGLLVVFAMSTLLFLLLFVVFRVAVFPCLQWRRWSFVFRSLAERFPNWSVIPCPCNSSTVPWLCLRFRCWQMPTPTFCTIITAKRPPSSIRASLRLFSRRVKGEQKRKEKQRKKKLFFFF